MYMYEHHEFYLVVESEPLEHNTDTLYKWLNLRSRWETKT